MADIFVTNAGNSIISYSLDVIKNRQTGVAVINRIDPNINIANIQDKYADRFKHQPPYSGN